MIKAARAEYVSRPLGSWVGSEEGCAADVSRRPGSRGVGSRFALAHFSALGMGAGADYAGNYTGHSSGFHFLSLFP
jgi:hypothetical protein